MHCFWALSGHSQITSKADRLENVLKLTKKDTSRVKVLNALFQEYLFSKPLKAKAYAEEALSISEKNKFVEGVIASSENIGEVYQTQSEYEKANEYFIKALDYQKIRNDRIGISKSYNQLGTNSVFLKKYDEALEYYQQCLEISQELNNLQIISSTYTNLGTAYFQKGNFTKAIELHIKALNLSDSLANRSLIAINLDQLGKIHTRINRYKDALNYYRQLLHLSKEDANIQYKVKAYLRMSEIYAKQEEYRKAFEYYQLYAEQKEDLINQSQTIKTNVLEGELDKQRIIQELQKTQLKQQKNITYAIATAAAFFLILIFILFWNNIQKQRINRLLEQKSEDIERKRAKLEEQTKKIEQQNEAINRKNETLEATFREIERKNKDITASINYAKRIQESMLPRHDQIQKAFSEYYILFKPRDIVSGDFYWFAQKGNKAILAAVDCTGHGVPGAIMSMLGDSYLNQIINTQSIVEPERILVELHKSIGIALNQEVTNNQDGMDVALCVIDKEAKTLEYAGASRTLLLIQDGAYEDIQSSRLPIGGFQKDRPREFIKHKFDISKPTSFYIFSDGFQDQFGGKRGRKFAKTRLINAIFENYQLPMSEQKEILNRTLLEWMGKNRQMDDILVIGVKI